MEVKCKAHRIRRGENYYKFDMIALLIVVFFGSAIIVTGLPVDSAVGYIHSRCHRGRNRRLHWTLDELLE